MKIAALIARYLLGLMFLVFGLNGFLHFIPQGPMPTGVAGQFTEAMVASHYMMAVAFFEVVGGALLLANLYVPLGLTLLAPVIVNILLFHALLLPTGLGLALVVVVLWSLVAWSVRPAFAGLFQKQVTN